MLWVACYGNIFGLRAGRVCKQVRVSERWSGNYRVEKRCKLSTCLSIRRPTPASPRPVRSEPNRGERPELVRTKLGGADSCRTVDKSRMPSRYEITSLGQSSFQMDTRWGTGPGGGWLADLAAKALLRLRLLCRQSDARSLHLVAYNLTKL